MQKTNEFAIPTLLATAWVNLALGGNKIQEACLTFEDIAKKYGHSFATLHGVGVCKLAMLKYAESEDALLRALEKVCHRSTFHSKADFTLVKNLFCSSRP